MASLMSTPRNELVSFASMFARQHGVLHPSVAAPNKYPRMQTASAMFTDPLQLASPVYT